LGRNVGVGILPTDAASQNPAEVSLMSVHEDDSTLARTVKTECSQQGPGPVEEPLGAVEAVDNAKNT
jgi:hypothetical protein